MPPKKAPAAARKKAPKNGYQMPEPLPLGTVLTDLAKQQWKIGPSIGTGGFGEIYSACKASAVPKKVDEYQYVVKIEPHNNGPLFVEMHFYMRNAKAEDVEKFRKTNRMAGLGMPHFVGSGSHELNSIKHRFVVMPRFGKDISKFWLENEKSLPRDTAYRLAIQMIDVLEYIHQCTYVHGDIKGANILLGLGKSGASQAYLVDFGLACHYTTSPVFKPDPKKMHNGTIEFTSRDAHCGVPTMRGDLEILAFNLVHWCGATLPWETGKMLENPVKVHEAKRAFMDDVSGSLKSVFGASPPGPLVELCKYVNTLEFNDAIDYTKCRQMFETGLKSLGKSNTGELKFKASPSPKKTAKATKAVTQRVTKRTTPPEEPDHTTLPTSKRPSRTTTRKAATPPLVSEDDEPAEPEPVKSPVNRKRTTTKDKSPPPKKAAREKENTTSNSMPTPTSTKTEGSLTINNDIQSRAKKKDKTYEFNFELDVSIDANVVINVKRKKKGTPARESPLVVPSKATPTTSRVKEEPLDSDVEEIAASPNLTPVASMRVLKRAGGRTPASRKSPRH